MCGCFHGASGKIETGFVVSCEFSIALVWGCVFGLFVCLFFGGWWVAFWIPWNHGISKFGKDL